MLTAENQQTPTKALGSDFARLDFASATKSKAIANAFDFEESDDDDFDTKKPTLIAEPLLVPNNRRFVLFPIQYQQIWASYKNNEAKFWSAEEIEFYEDIEDWTRVPAKEKACVLHALAVFSVNDLLAGDEPIISKMSDEIQIPEARCFFGFHIMQKNIHAESLNVLLDAFSKSSEDKDYLFSTLESMPTTPKRTAWVQKYITESPFSYSTRLFALAVYCTLFNAGAQTFLMHASVNSKTAASIKLNGRVAKFPGLLRVITKIQADMTRCVQFFRLIACEHMVNPINLPEAVSMVKDAVALEREIAAEIFEMGGVVVPSVSKKQVEVCGNSLEAFAVGKRLERVGQSLFKTFGLKAVAFGADKVAPEDSLEWLDSLLWDLIKKDSGVVEHHLAAKNDEAAKPQQEKTASVKQEFSLDDDF